MKSVNKAVRKKDAMELLLGKPVYTDDIAPKDCLVVKLLRSPYANAYVKSINTDIAMKVPGIEAIYTYKDVDQNMKRFTCAGQTYPEPSPYDRLILDKHVRFIGDPVAIVAGVDERCVDKAMKLIKAEYEVLEPVLDFTKAKDNEILVHPEDNWEALCPVGADNKRNLCAHDECSNGDIDKVLESCDVVIGMPAEHDGDIQDILYNRYLWKTSCCKFYTDSISLQKNHITRTWNISIKDTCYKA